MSRARAQAGTWLRLVRASNAGRRIDAELPHATEGTDEKYHLDEAYAVDKAAEMVEKDWSEFSLVTKLSATSGQTEAIDRLTSDGLCPGDGLRMEPHAKGVSFFAFDHGGSVDWVFVGRAQTKHARWLRQLLPYGATCQVSAVTGLDKPNRGVNVVLHLGPALEGLAEASAEKQAWLREKGQPFQGDTAMLKTSATPSGRAALVDLSDLPVQVAGSTGPGYFPGEPALFPVFPYSPPAPDADGVDWHGWDEPAPASEAPASEVPSLPDPSGADDDWVDWDDHEEDDGDGQYECAECGSTYHPSSECPDGRPEKADEPRRRRAFVLVSDLSEDDLRRAVPGAQVLSITPLP